ncbi:Guanosine nucleotide diphosphate dissociation inhibitor 2 [Camellia lanceoleosa]|uniref:Guanosine nucleotide diphosphate dissociation inhibitor 2 n=1 Tax=Camellia lanceoleosa TaxID=1840588 RepID=A0ACC0H2E3_9ERIC|nr:Guanosine nucleotide diphosphate dissociation inhibitor 2 [Camellia lanceoleosa]
MVVSYTRKGRKYGLEDDTIDSIGHALALHIDDNYLDQPAMDFVKRVKYPHPTITISTVKEQKFITRYLFCCSYTHNVASKGKYIAFVTTEAETDNPEVELKPDIDLLGPVDEIFFETYDRFVPTNNHDVDNCFISMLESLKSK